MPYQKYGDWDIPECHIRFPTESEAWEYISENANEEQKNVCSYFFEIKIIQTGE